ncbi:MAG: xanthine dehydrogenase family protein molybdopterin-binding subunit [Hyphomicrobiales bacterium]|nr:xanthine dehydrogenase family protein molybdopterin-binding subunit [Hyphomicrobiales bacterium]
MSRPNVLVGSPIERVEDPRLLRGRGTYVGDLQPDGLLHAAILRSPIAHGRLQRIDATAARALPGVVEVLTAADVGHPVPLIPIRQHAVPEGEAYRQPVLATDKVRYVGEPLAVVVASDPAVAEDALELITLAIEELPAVADHLVAARDETLLFEAAGTNRATVFSARMGDAEAAFAAADYTRRERFSVQRHTAHPMEPRGLLADWNAADGKLILHGAVKVPFFNRRTIATMLGLDAGAVDLIEVDVGGGFGARGELYPEDFLIPFAAHRLGRPVRWIEDRREHLMAMNHAREMYAELEIACRRDGRVLAIRGRIAIDLGAYARTNGFTTPRNVVQFVSGPYAIPGIAIDAAVLVTSKTPTGTYRGPGRFEASFFCERLLDMAAHDLGIDPADLRRKNLIPEDAMPYPLARILNVDESWQTECDNGAYALVLDRCLEEFGWARKRGIQGQCIDGRYHGVAIGCFIEGGAGGLYENARMSLEPDGTVSVGVGSSALGQGLATVLSQIAADALGLPLERIRLQHGSTTLVQQGFGSFHSRATVMGGSAILLAADALRARIRESAAPRLGCGAAQIELRDGAAHWAAQRVDFAQLAGLAIECTFRNDKLTYSYGAHAAHVAVDPRTGEVEIVDYLTVEDVGRVINPATLHGQVLGAVVQGLGSVFLEHLQYDENAQPLTGSLADYLLPTASDYPRIRSVSLGLRPCPNNPLGAKGAGEGGLIAVGGVVSNAIAAALRTLAVEPCDLPLSPPRLWRLIAQASGRAPQHLAP